MNKSSNEEKLIISLLERFKEVKGFFYGDTKTISFCKLNLYSSDLHVINRKLGGLGISDLLSDDEHKMLTNNARSDGYFEALKEEELAAYDLLTTDMDSNNKIHHVASTYLNAHKPQMFPVWDELYISLLLPEHEDYSAFKKALDVWKQTNGLETLNYFELHKFLWLYKDSIQKDLKIKHKKAESL